MAAKSFLTVIGLQSTNEQQNMAAHRSWQCHCVYWEMISENPDRVFSQFTVFSAEVSSDGGPSVVQMLRYMRTIEYSLQYIYYTVYIRVCVLISKNTLTVSHVKKLIWHEAGILVAVGQNLTFYLRLYSLCLYLLPAVFQLERRLCGGHLFLKDFSHFLSIEKSSSRNAVLFCPSPAERLRRWFVLRLEATSVCFSCYLWRSNQTFAFEGHIENRIVLALVNWEFDAG